MNVVGIIAEYNPFHNGHAYHIEQAKKLCHADACVVIMSPDFVQRGEPAIMNKYDRAHAALLSGADCVLELPVAFATGAARTFAEAGVALLDKLGIVTHLCFGSECGDIKPLQQIADILASEPTEYTHLLQDYMKDGLTFPAASQKAFEQLLSPSTAANALLPNNILAIEYLRALRLRNASMAPVTIMRTGSYHSTEMMGRLSSATALRQHLASAKQDPKTDFALLDTLPKVTHSLLFQEYQKSMPIFANDFSAALNHRLLYEKELASFEDVSTDLANQIIKQTDNLSTYDGFAELCKTRQYTRTRINRALLHIMLGITQENVRRAQQNDYGSYVRILGFRETFKPYLSMIKQKSALTLITKVAQARERLTPSDYQIFEATRLSSDLYRSVVSAKYEPQTYNEYTRGLILVP